MIGMFCGLDINASGYIREGWTLLMHACHMGQSSAAEVLLGLGADPDLTECKGGGGGGGGGRAAGGGGGGGGGGGWSPILLAC